MDADAKPVAAAATAAAVDSAGAADQENAPNTKGVSELAGDAAAAGAQPVPSGLPAAAGAPKRIPPRSHSAVVKEAMQSALIARHSSNYGPAVTDVGALPASMLELRDIEPNAVEVARQKPPARRPRHKLLQRDFGDVAVAAGVVSDPFANDASGLVPEYHHHHQDQDQQQSDSSKPTQKKVLDGFYLLKAGKVEFPEEVTRLVIQNKNLGSVADEDLPYFTNLKYLDASDNFFPLEKFGQLPALFELRLRFNDISSIGNCSSLKQLEVLDLSYNNLTEDAVIALSSIPRLRKLDLSGNNFQSLPDSMRKLRKVQELNLSSNALSDPAAVLRLADMPRLRELDLENNLLRQFPDCAEGRDFVHLEWVNLARNNIETEFDIGGLVVLKRLNHVVLFGNPLTDSGSGNDDDLEPFVDSVTVGDPPRTIRITCREQEPDAAEPLKDMYRSTKKTGHFGPAKVSGQDWKERGNKELFNDGGGASSSSNAADGSSGKKGKSKGGSGGNAEDDDEGRDIDWAAKYEDKAVLHPPSGIVELSAGKLHAAVVELREMLNNPVNYDPNYFLRHNFAKASASSARKAKKRIPYQPKGRPRRGGDKSNAERQKEKQKLSRIEGMLDRMALDEEDENEGEQAGGEMFATEIGGSATGSMGHFGYTDITRGITDAFNPSGGLGM